MREFPIAFAAALAACASPSTEPEIVQVEREPETCPHNYPCQPGTPWSYVICDAVCGEEGGYCEPYTPADELWCESHPGAVEDGVIVCDRWGNPQWLTKCKPYWIP